MRKINHLLDARAAKDARRKQNEAGTNAPPQKTYKQLARLIETFNKHGVRAYFVPMPQPEVWNLDPNLVQTVEAGGATIVDARAIEGMTEKDFSDGYHLGESGTEKFTRFLSEALANDLTR